MDVGYKLTCDCGCKDTTVTHEEIMKQTTDDGSKFILMHIWYNCKECDRERFYACAVDDTEEARAILKLEEKHTSTNIEDFANIVVIKNKNTGEIVQEVDFNSTSEQTKNK